MSRRTGNESGEARLLCKAVTNGLPVGRCASARDPERLLGPSGRGTINPGASLIHRPASAGKRQGNDDGTGPPDSPVPGTTRAPRPPFVERLYLLAGSSDPRLTEADHVGT